MIELDRATLLVRVGVAGHCAAFLTWHWSRAWGDARSQSRRACRDGDCVLQLVHTALLLLMYRLLLLLARCIKRRKVLRLLLSRSGAQGLATRAKHHLRALTTWLRSVCSIRGSHAITTILLAERSRLRH